MSDRRYLLEMAWRLSLTLVSPPHNRGSSTFRTNPLETDAAKWGFGSVILGRTVDFIPCIETVLLQVDVCLLRMFDVERAPNVLLFG